jgi:ribulose-phosphate 3-epimerase
MISNAEERVDGYIEAGADLVSIHPEATRHLQRALAHIREAGVKAGAALNPATPLSAIEWVIGDLDYLLLMSVNPGYEAQVFIPASIEKIRAAREMLDRHGSKAEIEVDGGVGPGNAAELAAAGATMLVAGSAVFKAQDPAGAVREISKAAASALGR